MSILELGSVQIVTIWRTGNGGTKIDFSDIKNWIKLCLVRYELAPRRQTATWLWQLFELPKMACEGSSYVRLHSGPWASTISSLLSGGS